MLSQIKGYDKIKQRYDALWECEIIDRPPVSITLPKAERKELPKSASQSLKGKWLDIESRTEREVINVQNTDYFADALPIVIPNLGPEIFSAWYGCGYEFGESTTWSEPCIYDWEKDSEKAKLDISHPLFKLTEKFTMALLEAGKDVFITGMTDYHAGGDHLAALRDPANLALDMIENIDFVKRELKKAEKDFFKVYDYFYEILKSHNQPISGWLPLFADGKYHIPSNDFSCMISNGMFRDVFLEGIINECRYMDKTIYHLDGPGALKHLDCLLDIKELDAVQWVYGAGNEGYHRWVDVYKKIQNKKKAIALYIDISELELVFETLKPEGVWFAEIRGIDSEHTANEVIKSIEKWR